jgi:hypothetical protein
MDNKIVKCCKECPWVVTNKNNDSIVDHSKKWKKKHNCHMLIKGREFKLWDDFPKFQCIGNKKEIDSLELIFTTNVDK